MSDPIIKTIGTIHSRKMERDAIHTAILQVKAAEPLVQGTTVKLDEIGNAIHCRREEAIGIVDPFLTGAVEVGDKCWVFIFPGTVTGMRHHFTLPAIDKVMMDEASKKWLEKYASDHREQYETLITCVTEFVNNGCTDPTMDDNFRDSEVPDEFWIHFKNVTGLDGQGDFWTCCL